MGKVISKVHEDRKLKFILNEKSTRHYCFRGVTKEYAMGTAEDIAADKRRANKNGNCKWSSIDLAVVPHPDKPGLYIVEDRSKEVR